MKRRKAPPREARGRESPASLGLQQNRMNEEEDRTSNRWKSTVERYKRQDNKQSERGKGEQRGSLLIELDALSKREFLAIVDRAAQSAQGVM